MPYSHKIVDPVPSSTTVCLESRESLDSHFKWVSIRHFLCIACVYSASNSYHFDLFSKLVYKKVTIFNFIIAEVFVGITYMFMDLFIKQYTRRIDFNQTLNPLLRGVTISMILQAAMWNILNARDLADALRYLVASVSKVPSWSKCGKNLNSTCFSPKDIINQCATTRISINVTSAHLNYVKSFESYDRSIITTRFFILALIWIFNFMISTVNDSTIIKFYRFVFVWRNVSLLFTGICLTYSASDNAHIAFMQLIDVNANSSFIEAVNRVAPIFGIGVLGIYDFGIMSPYTMIDNAVVIFSLFLTLFGFMKSMIVRVLYLVLTKCVECGDDSVSPHYLFFAMLPLSTEFLYAQKLYVIFLFANLMLALIAYLTLFTLTMTRLLHTHFRSVKYIYIVGIICVLGFGITTPMLLAIAWSDVMEGLLRGMHPVLLYLGGLRMAIIMWVYGVRRFSNDINFWLGFKPTRFWTLSWSVLPIVLLLLFLWEVYILTFETNYVIFLVAITWIAFSSLVVLGFQTKTLARYMLANNIVGAFKSSKRYGPPEREDREKRKHYNKSIYHRKCYHDCLLLDEGVDCNHLPLMYKRKPDSSETSLMHIYQADHLRHPSSVIDFTNDE